ITPIREKAAELQANETLMKEIIQLGAEKANKNAQKTLQIVRDAIGLNYF
ncbi:MAG: tryptophan--tRNA ligase, partial [Bacteroidetes bacterium]